MYNGNESYTVYAYLVDIEELRNVFGSGNTALVRRIKTRFSEEMARHNKWFADEIAGGAPGVEQALEEIVAGHIRSPDFGFQYGYALQMLCRELGSPLPSGGFADNRVIFTLPFSLPVIENGPPVPLPPIREFPSIGYLLPEQVRAELKRNSSPNAELQDDTFEQMRLDYVEWLEEADRTGSGVIAFCS